jgi:hypothetical protein
MFGMEKMLGTCTLIDSSTKHYHASGLFIHIQSCTACYFALSWRKRIPEQAHINDGSNQSSSSLHGKLVEAS